MKKKPIFLVLMVLMLVMIAGCSVLQVNTPVPNAQAGTPAPNGQSDGTSLRVQVYAPGPNPTVNTADPQGRTAGIVLGIWHGFISPVTLLLSFFNQDVQMYDVYNDGNLYNLGFFLGVAIVFLILGLLFGSRR